jgi:hypothetical protein
LLIPDEPGATQSADSRYFCNVLQHYGGPATAGARLNRRNPADAKSSRMVSNALTVGWYVYPRDLDAPVQAEAPHRRLNNCEQPARALVDDLAVGSRIGSCGRE